jgi:2-oxoisovalerate dehydrogenase E1 component
VLIVHEDTLTAGFAGEIIATIASQVFTYLDSPIERMGVPDVFIPFNPTLMKAVVPDAERIRQKIGEMLSY